MRVSSYRVPSDGHRFRLRSRGGHAQFNSPHFMSSLLTVKCRKSAHTALERGVVYCIHMCIVYIYVVTVMSFFVNFTSVQLFIPSHVVMGRRAGSAGWRRGAAGGGGEKRGGESGSVACLGEAVFMAKLGLLSPEGYLRIQSGSTTPQLLAPP